MNSPQADRGERSARPASRHCPAALCQAGPKTIVSAGAEPARGQPVGPETPQARGDTSLDLALVEAEFSRLWARWERAVEELGGAVPASQLRAVLLIDDTGAVSPGRLALGLGLSASSASSLSDRMETAGLLSYGAGVAADGQSGITLALTAAGQALAAWIRDRRPEVPWQLRFAQPACPRMGPPAGTWVTGMTAERVTPGSIMYDGAVRCKGR